MTQMSPDTELAKRLNDLTQRIIGCAFKVGGTLGGGYLEKVYENALAHELRKTGIEAIQQHRLEVWYDGIQVGEYIADLVIPNMVLIEVKAVRAFDSCHQAQCINYLTTTRLPICLLLNFSDRVHVRRIVGPNAPVFPKTNLGPSGSSVAMTWSEMEEFGDDRDNPPRHSNTPPA